MNVSSYNKGMSNIIDFNTRQPLPNDSVFNVDPDVENLAHFISQRQNQIEAAMLIIVPSGDSFEPQIMSAGFYNTLEQQMLIKYIDLVLTQASLNE